MEKDIEEKIVNCGAFGYDNSRISNITDIAIDEVNKQMLDKTSEMSKLYQKGKDISNYVIDVKLHEMAQAGDLKALDVLNKRNRNRK